MTMVNHVVVKLANEVGKKKRRILHDSPITPACADKQIIAALKQSYELLSFKIEGHKGTALVERKPVEEVEA